MVRVLTFLSHLFSVAGTYSCSIALRLIAEQAAAAAATTTPSPVPDSTSPGAAQGYASSGHLPVNGRSDDGGPAIVRGQWICGAQGPGRAHACLVASTAAAATATGPADAGPPTHGQGEAEYRLEGR